MFERFTEYARQVVVLAQEEARAMGHNYIGTEHLLLGMLRVETGLAAKVLESLSINARDFRARVILIVGRGEEVTSGQIPFTPRTKKILELALREALSLGHNYIGTESILLGLVRENEGVASRILLDFDADAERIRNEVMRILSDPGSRQRSSVAEPKPHAQLGFIRAKLSRATPKERSLQRRVLIALVDTFKPLQPSHSAQELATLLGAETHEVRAALLHWQNFGLASPFGQQSSEDVAWKPTIAAIAAVTTLLPPRERKPPYKR